LPTDSKTTINKAEIRAQESTLSSLTWESFDDLVKSTTSIWKIELNTDQWQNSKCSCIPFMKHYICKHIIAVANVFRLNTIPEQALQVPLGLKRKRGAPTKARTALIVQ